MKIRLALTGLIVSTALVAPAWAQSGGLYQPGRPGSGQSVQLPGGVLSGGAPPPLELAPSQQIVLHPDQSGMPPSLPDFDFNAFVEQASPEVIANLLLNQQQIERENADFVSELQRLQQAGLLTPDGPRSGGRAGMEQVQQLSPDLAANLQSVFGDPNRFSGSGLPDLLNKNLTTQQAEEERRRAAQAAARTQQELLRAFAAVAIGAAVSGFDTRPGLDRSGVSSTLTEEEIRRLHEEAANQAPGWLADYPFVHSNLLSPGLPDTFATWIGQVGGTAGDGSELSGSLYLGFGPLEDGYGVDGSMHFEDGGVEFTGTLPASASNRFTAQFWPGRFAGGELDGGDIQGSFYGPGAEEVGGQWWFDVVGGTRSGRASGIFAGQQRETH